VNGGAFHESLNMAALWGLPVVYLIENNLYGMGTAISRASAIANLTHRATSYNIPGEVVDGQDVHAVRDAVSRAVELARTDQVPTLLEARTYRFMGHSMSDAVSGTYRKKEELEEHMKRDPIVLLHQRMQQRGELTQGQLAQMDAEAKSIVEDALAFADNSPEPPLEALYEDVLVESEVEAAVSNR
jgi:pyruvate dehydrogenase E1 component alpha subunit